jgi:hypothetical protein
MPAQELAALKPEGEEAGAASAAPAAATAAVAVPATSAELAEAQKKIADLQAEIAEEKEKAAAAAAAAPAAAASKAPGENVDLAAALATRWGTGVAHYGARHRFVCLSLDVSLCACGSQEAAGKRPTVALAGSAVCGRALCGVSAAN